jgi:hypothetical protein
MPTITIYNDSDENLDADFDVIEIIGGKEVSRKTMRSEDLSSKQFRLYASNQAFMIVPHGTPCPRLQKTKRGRQIDAKPKTESKQK